MILIEVSNQETRSNFQLLKETEEWAKKNLGEGVRYTIILNPNLKEGEIKITSYDKQDTKKDE